MAKCKPCRSACACGPAAWWWACAPRTGPAAQKVRWASTPWCWTPKAARSKTALSKCVANCAKPSAPENASWAAFTPMTTPNAPRTWASCARARATLKAAWLAAPRPMKWARSNSRPAALTTRVTRRRPAPRCGPAVMVSSGSRKTTTTASTCCPNSAKSSPGKPPGCKCACLFMRPRPWSRSSATA